MSQVSDYRKKTRKSITCPSGLQLEIKKIRAIDYLKLGILPDTLTEMKDNPEKATPENLDKIQRMYLLSAVIPTDDFKIVDKALSDLADNEISYLEIEGDDINYIMIEVSNFSFVAKEGEKEDINPFREESVSSVA